ncbi:trafficking protein particle complex subunit 11 isoform X2 [Daktulosphaira vitifoliae]|uniref:trafficking protein particle complex subunit 11 isoform X2 n=1 Tax=Daktulosphaira vitifoliae TaxID=58002 RepID=UPI0021AA7200|nr:trafficking protein particle complex subunit 11 isoform X2 [Daktulosphaira vitifoliae]
MSNFQEFDFPPELCCSPSPLIAIAGLDTANNATHRSIWDAFHSSVGRESRAILNFFHLTSEFKFPPLSEKRVMPYIPKGILRKNWLEKHIRFDPAVVVIFYDCDWDDESWNEKISECSARVQSIRVSLEGRKSRIVVVLIQKRVPVTVTSVDDTITTERAASLCETCNLNPKALFILPVADNIHGYAIRLENAFYDLAQNYYQQQIRAVKSKLESLSKTSHQYLLVRYSFKIGFYNELRQDHHNAHKHYHQCYMSLLEIRTFDSNMYEIKVVAAYIIYKITRLLFLMKRSRDALTQFNSHINVFKSMIGPPELMFEHYSWLSKQYFMFASLFDETTAENFSATLTLNPGFFFKEAAEYAKKRKFSAIEICKEIMEYPSSNPLIGWNNIDFYGQRPWRLIKTISNTDFDALERDGIQALQYYENTKVDHSKSIISFLGNAMKQFKSYKCPRMRNFLAVQMANEYYNAKEYSKALTLWSHMLRDYRDEGWEAIAHELVKKCLKCAYIIASVQDYIELNLEALLFINDNYLQKALYNITTIIQKRIPEPENGLNEEEINTALNLWKTYDIKMSKSFIEVDMSIINSSIDTKVVLKEVSCDGVEIDIFVRAKFPVLIQFSKMIACISSYSKTYNIDVCNDSSKLVYGICKTYEYTCKFMPSPNDVGKEITVNFISLQLGYESELPIILKFNTSRKLKCFEKEINNFSLSKAHNDIFEQIKPVSSSILKPRRSRIGMEIKHENPALLYEWYKVSVSMHNLENFDVHNVSLNLSLNQNNVDKVENSTEICENLSKNSLSLPADFKLDTILIKNQSTQIFYVRSSSLDTRFFQIMINYTINDSGTIISCIKEAEIKIDVVNVFDMTATYMSSNFEQLSKIYVGESIIVQTIMKCVSPWPILIENSFFESTDFVTISSGGYIPLVNGVILETNESASDIVSLCVKQCNENSLGSFIIHWRRLNQESGCLGGTSKLHLPKVNMEKSLLLVDMETPAHGWLHTPMNIVYLLHNHSETLLTLEISMEANEAFMMSA